MPCLIENFREFLIQLGVFGIIAGALLVLNVAQRWLGEMLKLKLRQGLVHDLIQNWMVPGRAFRLANAGAIGVNPDQRMHEDARHLTELSADLGIGLLQDSILLITFISVLWTLSSGFAFHIGGRHIAVPGYMVWAAIIYSGSASLVSYWVGRSLVDRNARALCARSRTALFARAGQRAHRCDRARRRRGGRGAPHRDRSCERCSRPCAGW